MRRLVAAVVFGLLVLVVVPAARAADYPPGSPGQGTSRRAADRAGSPQNLAATGNDVARQLALGAGLIVVGGTILVVSRRRRRLYG